MQIFKTDDSADTIFKWVLFPLFFIAFYFILLIKVRPELIYQFQEPVFYFNQRFFADLLKFPGGLTVYFSRFLSQLYFFPWLGALTVTVITLLFSLCLKSLIRFIVPGWKGGPFVLYPAMALLILHSHYEYQLNNTLGLLIALGASLLYIRLTGLPTLLRMPVLVVLSIALYIAAGAPLLLFLALAALHEFGKGRRPAGILTVVCFAIPFLFAKTVFLVTIKNAYSYNLILSGNHPLLQAVLMALAAFFPLTALILMVSGRKAQDILNPIHMKHRGIQQLFHTVLFSALTGLLLILTFHENLRKSLLIDRYVRYQMWDKVIEATADRNENFDLRTMFHINRALYHTGQLLSQMFAYQQVWGAEGLLLPDAQGYVYPLQNSDLFLNLHHLNEAEHWAHESMSLRGETPWTLERLAIVNLAKGEYSAAHVFASKLSQSPLFRKKGLALRQLADHPEKIALNETIRGLQNSKLYPQKDFIYYTYLPAVTFERILANRSDNLMAFEYLMAYFMLTGRLNDFMQELPRARTFGYDKLPRHFEEAVLLYLGLGGERDQELLKGFKISNRTIQRFRHFQKILSEHKGNQAAALNELRKQHGDTYWYYALYVQPKESQND